MKKAIFYLSENGKRVKIVHWDLKENEKKLTEKQLLKQFLNAYSMSKMEGLSVTIK
jgi:hypothetical protein